MHFQMMSSLNPFFNSFVLWWEIYIRSFCWVFDEDVVAFDSLPSPVMDLDENELVEPVELSRDNPFDIDPEHVEWMNLDDFDYY